MHKIAIIGLGYVGLPLAVAFGKKFDVIGFDLNERRINNLKSKKDTNNEFNKLELKKTSIKYTNRPSDLHDCNIYIVTVPTPVTKKNLPDLNPITKATLCISKYLKKKDIVIYESTVFPGVTEEYCAPLLERKSKLKFNVDFFCGYSPERINPGDKLHTLEKIIKIVSASNDWSLRIIKNIYGKIIKNKIYIAKNIRTAEAAKIIENTQRDLNISLINECAILFNKMNISIFDVLKAASTKWNFLNFYPGLVGGHCIGVDPYYLTYKAKQIGIKPKVILAGRKVNNYMPTHVAKILLKNLKKKTKKKNFKIIIFGATFKENISDIRNSKILEVGKILKKKGHNIHFIDYNIQELKDHILVKKLKKNTYDGILLGVPHKRYLKMQISKLRKIAKKNHVIFDITNKYEIKKEILSL